MRACGCVWRRCVVFGDFFFFFGGGTAYVVWVWAVGADVRVTWRTAGSALVTEQVAPNGALNVSR